MENLTAIRESEQTMAAYLLNSFFSAGYLMAASIVALKCLNLVPDLAAWMIPEGDTAFSTRNFGEGVAQQAKMSPQGMISKVIYTRKLIENMVIKNLENKIKLVLIICSLFLVGCIIICISSIWTAKVMVSDAHQ